MQFEELHAKQSQWIVPDQELRESLRLAVAEVLLPAYRSFIKRFGYNIKSFRLSPTNTKVSCTSNLHHFVSASKIYDCINLVACSNLVENNKNPQKYVRYSPEAVDQLLGQFFEGQQWAEQKR
jgi:exocyst complex protein 7